MWSKKFNFKATYRYEEQAQCHLKFQILGSSIPSCPKNMKILNSSNSPEVSLYFVCCSDFVRGHKTIISSYELKKDKLAPKRPKFLVKLRHKKFRWSLSALARVLMSVGAVNARVLWVGAPVENSESSGSPTHALNQAPPGTRTMSPLLTQLTYLPCILQRPVTH